MLIWTDNAIMNITNFIENAKEGTKNVAKSYMDGLLEYANIIDSMNFVGKKINYIVSEYDTRQVIYKKHRIIYHVEENNIIILAVVHTRLDMKKVLDGLKEN